MNDTDLYATETLCSREEDSIKWWEVEAERDRQKVIKKLYGKSSFLSKVKKLFLR